MGILNVTPDSFSDGGQDASVSDAVDRAMRMITAGADILDIGGESTRPGSRGITLDEELQRVIPVVTQLCQQSPVPISVDTSKAEVARQALAAGACIINDVTGLRGDPDMVNVASSFGAGAIVMHMQGTPATMQVNPTYDDVVQEVDAFFRQQIEWLTESGLPRECICLDPGIGFGKTLDHNLQLLAGLRYYQHWGVPVCLGVSRKGFLGQVCDRKLEERMPGSLAVACFAMAHDATQVIRVHDVAPTRDAVLLHAAIRQHLPMKALP